MTYLSKGILLWKTPEAGASVSHCGKLHKLSGSKAELWLSGQYAPAKTVNTKQGAELRQLAELGIAVIEHDADDAALFRLLTNCAICPARAKTKPAILNRQERRQLRWIRRAGLRLTMAELVRLAEGGISPVRELLGDCNRQALTETIYSPDNIGDGILECQMERSPARDITINAILSLLRKRKIYLL